MFANKFRKEMDTGKRWTGRGCELWTVAGGVQKAAKPKNIYYLSLFFRFPPPIPIEETIKMKTRFAKVTPCLKTMRKNYTGLGSGLGLRIV